MTNTINNAIPFVPENTIDPAAGLNISLNTIDALLQVLVISVGLNTPPAGVEGNRYIVGTSPTGLWAGQANKLARYLNGVWHFYDARYALNATDGMWYMRAASTWSAASASFTGGTLSSALNEAPLVTLASASTVNIGAAASNSIFISGAVTITSLGTIAAGAKRILIFQGAPVITHNATSLILPTSANITAAAGDVAEFISLGSGNWRCTDYQRFSGEALVGGSGGEANTASNLGAGEGLYASKSGVDLRFKSLVEGTNVTLTSDGDTVTINAAGGGGSGTVTSVAATVPTGFDISGSPITSSGTLAITFSTGYSLPTNTNQSNWSTAYGWGDHSAAGYEKELSAGANISIDRTDPDNPVISASASSGMTNPMTTAGDIIKGGASGVPERLAVGTDGKVLGVVSGAPAWVDPASGSGNVVGPASSTNNEVALFDGVTGELLKGGGVLGSAAFDDTGDFAKTDVAQTWSAIQTFGKALRETKVAVAAVDIDVSLGSIYTKTISSSTTFTVSSVPSTGTTSAFILDLTNGGSAVVTWWSGVKWANGSAPTLTAAGRDVLGFFTHDGGTTWTGLILARDAK